MFNIFAQLYFVIFILFIIISYLWREFSVIFTLFYLVIIILVTLMLIIVFGYSAFVSYMSMILALQYVSLPPLGIPLGYGINEFMNRLKKGGLRDGIIVIRKLLPLIYMFYLLYTVLLPSVIPAFVLSLLLFAFEWYKFKGDKYGMALTILNTLTLIFMPPIMAIPASAMIALVLDAEFLRRPRDSWFVAITYAFSALLAYLLLGLYKALVILIPITYVMLVVTAETIIYLTARFNIEINSPLKAVEGKEFIYDIVLRSKPKINALITANATDGISLIQPSQYFNGSMVLKAHAIFERGGIFNPKVIVNIEDPRGFIKLRKEINHAPIIVIPRSTYILGLYQRMLGEGVVRGFGEITGVRDYMPGDPIRRIHWPKSVKSDKYVIKVFSKFINTIAVIPYASNVRNLNKIEKLLMSTVMALLSQGTIPTFLIIDPINYSVMSIRWSSNYVNVLTNVLKHMKSLDIKYLSRGLGSEVFQGVRMIHRENIIKALSKIMIEKPLILIGEERLSIDVLNALQELVGRENVKYILI